MKMLGSKAAGKQENKLKYNGKEMQSDLNLEWTDYGARMYDQQVGRWWVTDPKSEKSLTQSVYTYCSNNPIIFLDPNGESDYYFNNVGDLIGIKRNDARSDEAYKIDNESNVSRLYSYDKDHYGWGQQTDVQKVGVFKSFLFENRDNNKTPFGTTESFEKDTPSKVESELKKDGSHNTKDPGLSNKPIGRWSNGQNSWYVFNRQKISPNGMLTDKEFPHQFNLPTPAKGKTQNLPSGSLPSNIMGQQLYSPYSNTRPLTDPNGNIVPYHRQNGGILFGEGPNTYIPPKPDIQYTPRYIGDYGPNTLPWLIGR